MQDSFYNNFKNLYETLNVKDKAGNILLSPQNKNKYLNQNENIINLINKKEWNDALFQNQTLKAKINSQKNYTVTAKMYQGTYTWISIEEAEAE